MALGPSQKAIICRFRGGSRPISECLIYVGLGWLSAHFRTLVYVSSGVVLGPFQNACICRYRVSIYQNSECLNV
jgi:hypothetical protein